MEEVVRLRREANLTLGKPSPFVSRCAPVKAPSGSPLSPSKITAGTDGRGTQEERSRHSVPGFYWRVGLHPSTRAKNGNVHLLLFPLNPYIFLYFTLYSNALSQRTRNYSFASFEGSRKLKLPMRTDRV